MVTTEEIEKSIRGLIQVQEMQAKTVSVLATAMDGYFKSAETRMQAFDVRLQAMDDLMQRNMENSNVRMTRIEENLEVLIRALTDSHGNGKG